MATSAAAYEQARRGREDRGLVQLSAGSSDTGTAEPASPWHKAVREDAALWRTSSQRYARVDGRSGQPDALLLLTEVQVQRRQAAGVPDPSVTGTGVGAVVLAPVDSSKLHVPPYLSSLDPVSVRAFYSLAARVHREGAP